MTITQVRQFERMSGWLSRQSIQSIFCGYLEDSHGQPMFWTITDDGDHIPMPLIAMFAGGLSFYRFAQ